jgi:hypothetical protein
MSNIEVIQFGPGGAELGMTRMNMIEIARSYSDSFWGSLETYIVVIFAYVVAMFIAGIRLRRMEYITLTTTYSLFAVFVCLATVNYASLSLKWLSYSGLKGVGSGYPIATTMGVILLSILVISIWFGWSIRNPKVSGSAPAD